MQERMQALQAELAQLEVTGEAGAGMVKRHVERSPRGAARADRSEHRE